MDIIEVSSSVILMYGIEMELLPEAAIYIPARKELLIADLHLGKAEHFRKNGIGIPGEITYEDLSKLEKLINKQKPQKVIFLGDLFHSDYNSSWEKFLVMLETFNLIEFHLVVGNHDIMPDEKYEGLKLSQNYCIGNIVCTHEPLDVSISGRYNLCGHIHPGVKLRGRGRQSMKLPCFYFGTQTGILPAFGSFTGMHTIKPLKGDIVYVIAEDNVNKVH